jgi:hypothetical protein
MNRQFFVYWARGGARALCAARCVVYSLCTLCVCSMNSAMSGGIGGVIFAQELREAAPSPPEAAPFVRQGIYDKPFMTQGFGTTIGGYGDIHLRFLRVDGATDTLSFIPERFNLFTYTPVGDRVRVALELEIEDAGAEIKLELAVIDFEIHEALTFRAGILLSPIGRFNLAHDSPANDLTARPLVSTDLLGVTLSEVGMGFFGAFYPWRSARITYELYAVNGFSDGVLLRSPDGVRLPAGRANFRDNDNTPSVVGRLAFSPLPPIELGFSAHFGPYNRIRDLDIILDDRRFITLSAFDWDIRWSILQLQGEYAFAHIDIPPSMQPLFASLQHGAYIQLGVRLLDALTHTLPSSSLSFALRLDALDLDLDLNGDSVTRITSGLCFRPLPETALKLDYHYAWRSDRASITTPEAGINFSVASYF